MKMKKIKKQIKRLGLNQENYQERVITHFLRFEDCDLRGKVLSLVKEGKIFSAYELVVDYNNGFLRNRK